MVSKNYIRKRGTLDRSPVLDYSLPQLAKIKSSEDFTHNGKLLVWLTASNTDESNSANWISVQYASPFAGSTDPEVVDRQAIKSFSGTQKSYGIFAVPPDTNNFVLVLFANADETQGYWFACVYKDTLTHMVPGIGSDNTYTNGTAPTAEMNIFSGQIGNPQVNPTRPTYTPLFTGLTTQGLINDPIRGVGTSSVWRDTKPTVSGWLTPGGNQLILDDGNGTAPQFIRIRTPSGTQLLVSETDGNIYAISKDGNSWIELNNDGHIDMYSSWDVSIRADKNINMSAGQFINFQAAKFNFVSSGDFDIQVSGSFNALVTSNINLESTGGSFNFLISSGEMNTQASGNGNFLFGGGFNLQSDGDGNMNLGGGCNIEATGTFNMLTAGNVNFQSSGGTMNLNSNGALSLTGSEVDISPTTPAPGAGPAGPAGTASAATGASGPLRVPTHEPFNRST